MNPFDVLFQTVSSLTAGIVTDIETAMVSILAVLLVVLGVKLLAGCFDLRKDQDEADEEGQDKKRRLLGRD